MVLLAYPAIARADDAKGGAGFLIYNAQLAAPNEVGTDVSTARKDAPRLRVVWSNQIPLGLFPPKWSMGDDERDVPLMRHRLVLSMGLAFGRQTLPGGNDVERSSLDGRVGTTATPDDQSAATRTPAPRNRTDLLECASSTSLRGSVAGTDLAGERYSPLA